MFTRLDAHGVNFNGVFVMRTDGTHLRRITSNRPDAPPDGQPQFSPDGRYLVFQREVPTGNQLMIVRTDGQGLRRLLPGLDGFAASWARAGSESPVQMGCGLLPTRDVGRAARSPWNAWAKPWPAKRVGGGTHDKPLH